MTIGLDENSPSEGLAFAPSKTTETIVQDENFTDEALGAFISRNYATLSQPGMYVGGWLENGEWYLDISRVGGYSADTLREAQAAEQLAVFDLKTLKTHTIGTITNDTYEPVADPEVVFGQAWGERNG